MAISWYAIVAIMAILMKMAIMAKVNKATNVVFIGVYTKNRKNVDTLWKRNSKMRISSKIMAKTKYFVTKGSKMADFLCIFVRNLERMAPGLGWWENSDIFLVTPEEYAQPWLALRKDFQNFNFFRTP